MSADEFEAHHADIYRHDPGWAAYYDTFTFTCPHCGDTTQVIEGMEIGHGCPPAPAVEISGCGDDEEVPTDG